jgi:hypothetical protein
VVEPARQAASAGSGSGSGSAAAAAAVGAGAGAGAVGERRGSMAAGQGKDQPLAPGAVLLRISSGDSVSSEDGGGGGGGDGQGSAASSEGVRRHGSVIGAVAVPIEERVLTMESIGAVYEGQTLSPLGFLLTACCFVVVSARAVERGRGHLDASGRTAAEAPRCVLAFLVPA